MLGRIHLIDISEYQVKDIDQIKTLISENRVEEGLDILISLAQKASSSYENDFLALKSDLVDSSRESILIGSKESRNLVIMKILETADLMKNDRGDKKAKNAGSKEQVRKIDIVQGIVSRERWIYLMFLAITLASTIIFFFLFNNSALPGQVYSFGAMALANIYPAIKLVSALLNLKTLSDFKVNIDLFDPEETDKMVMSLFKSLLT